MERKVQKIDITDDASCLFRCLSHFQFNTQDYYKIVRSTIVRFIVKNWPIYKSFIVGGGMYEEEVNIENSDDYETYMSGDHVPGSFAEIHAFSDLFRNVYIRVYQDGIQFPHIFGFSTNTHLFLRRSNEKNFKHYDIIQCDNNNIAICNELCHKFLLESIEKLGICRTTINVRVNFDKFNDNQILPMERCVAQLDGNQLKVVNRNRIIGFYKTMHQVDSIAKKAAFMKECTHPYRNEKTNVTNKVLENSKNKKDSFKEKRKIYMKMYRLRRKKSKNVETVNSDAIINSMIKDRKESFKERRRIYMKMYRLKRRLKVAKHFMDDEKQHDIRKKEPPEYEMNVADDLNNKILEEIVTESTQNIRDMTDDSINDEIDVKKSPEEYIKEYSNFENKSENVVVENCVDAKSRAKERRRKYMQNYRLKSKLKKLVGDSDCKLDQSEIRKQIIQDYQFRQQLKSMGDGDRQKRQKERLRQYMTEYRKRKKAEVDDHPVINESHDGL